LHLTRLANCGAFITILLCFTYLIMATNIGYVYCEECGRQFWYIRWFAFMFCGPALMLFACDLSLLGFQFEINPEPLEGLIGTLLNMFLSKTQKAAVETALGVLKGLIDRTFGTDAARGYKWALMGASFIQNLCLGLATVSCGPLKWAFFSMSLVFFIPQTHALLIVLPNAAATMDPTLIGPVKKLLINEDLQMLVGAFFRFIRTMTFTLWVMIMLQSFTWVATYGVPFWCANVAAWWFFVLDLLTFLLPQGMGFLGWPMTLSTLMQGIVEPAIQGVINGIDDTIVPLSQSAAPGAVVKTTGWPNADNAADDERNEPMPLDAERAMDPPNENHDPWTHGLRCALFGSKTTKIYWNLICHSHIGPSFLDHCAMGNRNVENHFLAVINMLHKHQELN